MLIRYHMRQEWHNYVILNEIPENNRDGGIVKSNYKFISEKSFNIWFNYFICISFNFFFKRDYGLKEVMQKWFTWSDRCKLKKYTFVRTVDFDCAIYYFIHRTLYDATPTKKSVQLLSLLCFPWEIINISYVNLGVVQ